jgi:hypothetical protein
MPRKGELGRPRAPAVGCALRSEAPADAVRTRTFLLSPANLTGKRAQLLLSEGARCDLARRLRSRAGVPLGEVFSFVSGLYFRGKLTYAVSFGRTESGVRVILPGEGLQPVDRKVRLADLLRFAAIPVDVAEARYRLPLMRDCERLARALSPGDEVVLLGSVATRKYLDILEPIFAEALRIPREFIGRGDMSRGALLLRAARDERELDYVPTPGRGPVP